MNPFRKRSKSTSAADTKKLRRNVKGGAQLSGAPQIISTLDVAFSLPSENAFRTSLLLPKMADRFSFLRLDESGQSYQKEGFEEKEEHSNPHSGTHTRDLSILEEYDEEDEDLPVLPWDRRETRGPKEEYLPAGVSKDEFIRVRAQEGNSSLFSGKQRTFKFKPEEGHDIDRQYSSSSMSSKSPHSPAFDYRPPSSHTSATSSILFTTSKPAHVNSKAAATLGFDFGLPEPQSLPVQPPSPTSTVYEVIDSPTVPDFLLAEDEPAIVDAVRNHLQRPDTSHTQAPAPNYHEAQYPRPQRRNSRGKKTETVFQVDDGDRGSLFWDDNASVFDYYGEILNGDDVEEMERAIMGEEWIQTRQTGQQPSKTANTAPNTPKGLRIYPNSPKSPKNSNKYPPPKSPRNYPNPPKSPSFHPNPPPSPILYPNSQKSSNTRAQKNTRESLFSDLPPSSSSLNVKTNVTILKPPTAAPQTAALRTRDSDDSIIASSAPYKTVRPIQYESGGVLGLGYEASIVQEVKQDSNTPPKRSRQGSNVDNSPLSQSNYNDPNPAISAISTDPRYITPELHSTSIFPNTPPPSVSPSQNGFVSQPHISHVLDRSLTPPPSTSERRAPSGNVKKALKDRIISEPQLISMTATVPTVPIIRMGDHKVEQLRTDSRKTRMNSGRKPRKPMLDDEVDDISTSSSVPNFDRKSQAGLFTRQKRGSPPAVATRGESRRRETTAGSVLFDDQLRDRAQSPPSSRLPAGPEYSMRLPSPHRMNDNPYDPIVQHSSRHRRKVSRQEVDPVVTLSSPAILNQWDGHPRRRTEGGFDPAW